MDPYIFYGNTFFIKEEKNGEWLVATNSIDGDYTTVPCYPIGFSKEAGYNSFTVWVLTDLHRTDEFHYRVVKSSGCYHRSKKSIQIIPSQF